MKDIAFEWVLKDEYKNSPNKLLFLLLTCLHVFSTIE